MKKRIIAVLMVIVTITILVTSSFSVSASMVEYPFPDAKTLIGNNNYIIFLRDDKWQLITYDDTMTMYVKGLNNQTEYLVFEDDNTPYPAGGITPDMSAHLGHFKRYNEVTVGAGVWTEQTNFSASNTTIFTNSYAPTLSYYSNKLIEFIPQVGSSLTSGNFFPSRLWMGAISLKPVLTSILGILPYLVTLLIICLAFWKGWGFLSTTLRRA